MRTKLRTLLSTTTLLGAGLILASCAAQPGPVNTNIANNNSANANTVPSNMNSNAANSNSTAQNYVPEAAEPEQYQATVSLKLTAIGQQQANLPTLSAQVARSGADRRMVFTMPAGGRVVYLDKAGTNYLVLPDKKQYAELNQDSLGFEVRQLLMPEQIVAQIKKVQGLERVGEEPYNGRDAIKYRYGAVANTGTQAGQVATESYLWVDKATGLPLHSETVSQATGGGNVQGYNGLRIVTDITDIQDNAPADLFAEPTGLQKIESSQISSQVDMIFNSVASLLAQALNQARQAAPAPTPTPGK